MNLHLKFYIVFTRTAPNSLDIEQSS